MKLRKSTSERILSARVKNTKYIAKLKSSQQKAIKKWIHKEIRSQLKTILEDMHFYRQPDPYTIEFSRVFSQQDWLREQADTIIADIKQLLETDYAMRFDIDIQDSDINSGYLVDIVIYPFEDPQS